MPQYRGSVDLTILSSAASPASGYWRLYPKADNELYMVSSSGVEHQVNHSGAYGPGDHGLLTWSFDFSAVTAGQAMTAGTIYLVGQQVPRSASVTTIYWVNQAAGTTLTAGQCWAALLNSSGTVLQTVDIASKGAAGSQTATITSTAVTPGQYWVAFLFNGASLPAIGRGSTVSAGVLNIGKTAATARYATNGTSQTTITNRTPASNTNLAAAMWVGLS